MATIFLEVENRVYPDSAGTRDAALKEIQTTVLYNPPANVSGKLCELSVDNFLLYADPAKFTDKGAFKLSSNLFQPRGFEFKESFYVATTANNEFKVVSYGNNILILNVDNAGNVIYEVPPGIYTEHELCVAVNLLIEETVGVVLSWQPNTEGGNYGHFFFQGIGGVTDFTLVRYSSMMQLLGWDPATDHVSDVSGELEATDETYNDVYYDIRDEDSPNSTTMIIIHPGTYTQTDLLIELNKCSATTPYSFDVTTDPEPLFVLLSDTGTTIKDVFANEVSTNSGWNLLGFETNGALSVSQRLEATTPMTEPFSVYDNSNEAKMFGDKIQSSNYVIATNFMNCMYNSSHQPIIVQVPDGPRDLTFVLTKQSTSDDEHANYVTYNDSAADTEISPAYLLKLTLTPMKSKKHHEDLESYSTGPFIRF